MTSTVSRVGITAVGQGARPRLVTAPHDRRLPRGSPVTHRTAGAQVVAMECERATVAACVPSPLRRVTTASTEKT
jgi:hypothetical protein